MRLFLIFETVIIVVFVLALVIGMYGAAWLDKKKINMAFIPIGVDYFQGKRKTQEKQYVFDC